MMLVGLMFVDGRLFHGFEDFVDNLDLSVGLKVLWGGELLGES
jgi:hypothetical protein